MTTTWDTERGVEINSNWDRERGLTGQQAEELRSEILDFISDSSQHMAYLMTRRRDGREVMRPVATFVENWMVGTITQDIQPKSEHVRRDPIVGYLWVGRENRSDRIRDRWNPPVVWMQGRAELVEDQEEVSAFFERRVRATGGGRGHPPEDTLYLIKVTPEYVRAEGWAGMHAIVYRDFPGVG